MSHTLFITLVLAISHLGAFCAGAVLFYKNEDALDKNVNAVTTEVGTLKKAADEIKSDL